jgi:pimeloyl-ACP methyl ester carboxylesterase
LRYIDPSGHTNQCAGYWDSGCHKGENHIIVILACGDGMGANCKGAYSDYSGKKPLSHFEELANENGDQTVYFGADSYTNENGENSVELYADAINNFMSQYPDAHFIMIGHSRGAAAVVWAANNFAEENDPKQISEILTLDTNLSSDPKRKDTQLSVDDLVSKGVPISSYNSIWYKLYDARETVNLPIGSQTSLLSETHEALATNQLYWITWERMVFIPIPTLP